MSTLQKDLQSLFERDLNTLIENIEATLENKLWKVPTGVTNSVGVLTQHLVGNLNHFIGKGIGKTGYVRQRELEFKNTGVSKEKLITGITDLKNTLGDIFDAIEDEKLSDEFPLDIPYEATIQGFLIHLYGHLNYHLGQVNYLRRILSEKDENKSVE